jgi:hypothetical protein
MGRRDVPRACALEGRVGVALMLEREQSICSVHVVARQALRVRGLYESLPSASEPLDVTRCGYDAMLRFIGLRQLCTPEATAPAIVNRQMRATGTRCKAHRRDHKCVWSGPGVPWSQLRRPGLGHCEQPSNTHVQSTTTVVPRQGKLPRRVHCIERDEAPFTVTIKCRLSEASPL